MTDKKDLERVVKAVVRKYPTAAGLALANVKIDYSNEVPTACVCAKKNSEGILEVEKILVNPEFFGLLTFSQRVFVIAHEALHIAFKHFARSLDKPEKDAKNKYLEYCKKESDPQKRKAMELILLQKYHRIWNIATDACINAFLKKDGFAYPEDVVDPKTGEKLQFVDLEDGLIKSAEKIYDSLVKKEEEKEKQQQEQKQNKQSQGDSSDQKESKQSQSGSSNQENGESNEQKNNSGESSDGDSKNDDIKISGLDDIDPDNYRGFDSHDQWDGGEPTTSLEDSDERSESSDQKEESKASDSPSTQDDQSKNESKQDSQDGSRDDSKGSEDKEPQYKATDSEDLNDSSSDIDEEKTFEKELKARESKKQTDKDAFSKIMRSNGIGEVKPVKPILSWKRILQGSFLEKGEEVWSYRRASHSNPNPRVEERITESLPDVEIILDKSGSISDSLLRGFLYQLYPILMAYFGEEKFSIKVGTFAERFSGFEEIRSKQDIANYSPVSVGISTDFELAATSFSYDPGRRIKKIVFTDGVLGYPQRTRMSDIIWIVFGNEMDFSPLGGQIIKVSEEDYEKMEKQDLI